MLTILFALARSRLFRRSLLAVLAAVFVVALTVATKGGALVVIALAVGLWLTRASWSARLRRAIARERHVVAGAWRDQTGAAAQPPSAVAPPSVAADLYAAPSASGTEK